MSEELLEVSSDCDDTIIIPANDDFISKSDSTEYDIESIVNKYIAKNSSFLQKKTDPVVELSDEEPDDVPFMKKLMPNEDVRQDLLSPSSSSQDEDQNNDKDVLQMLSHKYKPVSSEKDSQSSVDECEALNPRTKKELKQLQQRQKSEERKRKKAEIEREKCLKQVLAAANKNIKPGECMKFICVHLDNDVVNEYYGTDIINALQAADVNYTLESQIFSRTISWTRKTQAHLIDDDGKLTFSSQNSDTDDILLIMECKEFIEHIHNSSLIAHIQSIRSVLINKRITLLILNLKDYMKHQTNHRQNEFSRAISQENHEKQTKDNEVYKNFPKVSMKNVEYALTELQILCKCCYRTLNSASEVALTVVQFTKAVAEIPYKLKKHEKYEQIDWFAAGDNRDCVKVDKNGNGLQRLWKQMLTTFPLVNLEIAEAISAVYPAMTSLIEAYEDCPLEKRELLLQDIPIRRAAGPLSSSRRLGPELSKKLCSFFTSIDGDVLV